jgi:hypothetical protein
MRPTRIRHLLLPVATAALLLAACSSSSSDSSSTTSAPASKAGDTTTKSTAGGSSGDSSSGKPIDRYADYKTKSYDEPSHWVCRPDMSDDICHGNLDSTTITADGKLTVEKFAPAKSPKIDCFYIYPTISRDQSNFSDWNASPDEEGFVTLNQAARLAQDCRVFAPVYRQGTLAGLTGRLAGGAPKFTDKGDPFADVLDAFRTYMAQDNDGRGFVLIGHSQGTGMLIQLISKEIDSNADVRKLLVGAYLAGGSVAVPEGKVVGGSFQHVPLCTKDGEAGCAANWSTFRSTAPPPANSFFGTVRGGNKPGQEAGCVNPANPGASDTDTISDPYFPADSKASILSSLGAAGTGSRWVDASAGEVTTPYVRLPGLVSVQCKRTDGFHYLQATVHPDPGPRADDIPGDITPEWGLHLVDVNLVMGDIVHQVAEQAKSYAG